MTTQVIFKLDKKLKDQAMKKAQNEGLTFSSVLKMATKAFVEGEFTIGFIPEETFNTKTRKDLDQALEDIKAGKNLSPSFKSHEQAIAYLKR